MGDRSFARRCGTLVVAPCDDAFDLFAHLRLERLLFRALLRAERFSTFGMPLHQLAADNLLDMRGAQSKFEEFIELGEGRSRRVEKRIDIHRGSSFGADVS